MGQCGERCTQTGPWRVDPCGRVRMPVRGPRGVEGWLTLDARKCRNAEGAWGEKYLDFIEVPKITKPVEEIDKHISKPQAQIKTQNAFVLVDDVEDLLDMFGHEESPQPGRADDFAESD